MSNFIETYEEKNFLYYRCFLMSKSYQRKRRVKKNNEAKVYNLKIKLIQIKKKKLPLKGLRAQTLYKKIYYHS